MIHETLPAKAERFTKYDLVSRGGLSYVELWLNTERKKVEGLFDFDTKMARVRTYGAKPIEKWPMGSGAFSIVSQVRRIKLSSAMRSSRTGRSALE